MEVGCSEKKEAPHYSSYLNLASCYNLKVHRNKLMLDEYKLNLSDFVILQFVTTFNLKNTICSHKNIIL